MDGKERIELPFGEQENIDISISYTPACSIYVALVHGIAKIKEDLAEMDKYLKFVLDTPVGGDSMFKTIQEKLDAQGNVNQQKLVAKLALDNTLKFQEELQRVINELDPDSPKKKPLIIAPPGWSKK
jgi:hypothetical protein